MLPPDEPAQTKPVTRGDIQGLRAVAVLLVVLSHASVPGFGGGFVGVDVFFVISGFLITGILLREVSRTGRVSILDFYARRARRILPAASVVLLAVTGASWLALGYIRLSEVLDDIVWASLFGANIHEAQTGTDYFAQDSFLSPVQHFWSLAVEEQFYLLWPALLAVLALTGRRHLRRHLAVLLVVLCAASLAWSLHQTATLPASAYFSTLTRGWELGTGALLALVAPRLRQCTRGFLGLCSWAGLAMIAWSCVSYTGATPFPGSAAVVPVVGSALVLAGGVRPTPVGASLVLDRVPMRWIGDISYSLYLWHWPVLVIPAAAAGRTLGLGPDLVLVLVAVALAALTYRYVETPFRDRHFWRHGRLRSLSLWPAAVAVVLAAVSVVGLQTSGTADGGRPELDPRQADGGADITTAVQRAAASARQEDPLPDGLTPSPLELIDDNWELDPECFSRPLQVEHEICTMGDTAADRTIVLFGDSHMGMWTAPIIKRAQERHWKVVAFLKTGCHPYDTPMWSPEVSGEYTQCAAWRAWSQAQITRLQPERIIATGFSLAPQMDADTGEELVGGFFKAGTQTLATGMRKTLARLTDITPTVAVIGDTTLLREPAIDCLGARNADLGTCATKQYGPTAARNAELEEAARAAGAQYVDVAPWLCDESTCPLVVGNVVVYTDRHHLTSTYVRALEPVLAAALRL